MKRLNEVYRRIFYTIFSLLWLLLDSHSCVICIHGINLTVGLHWVADNWLTWYGHGGICTRGLLLHLHLLLLLHHHLLLHVHLLLLLLLLLWVHDHDLLSWHHGLRHDLVHASFLSFLFLFLYLLSLLLLELLPPAVVGDLQTDQRDWNENARPDYYQQDRHRADTVINRVIEPINIGVASVLEHRIDCENYDKRDNETDNHKDAVYDIAVK